MYVNYSKMLKVRVDNQIYFWIVYNNKNKSFEFYIPGGFTQFLSLCNIADVWKFIKCRLESLPNKNNIYECDIIIYNGNSEIKTTSKMESSQGIDKININKTNDYKQQLSMIYVVYLIVCMLVSIYVYQNHMHK